MNHLKRRSQVLDVDAHCDVPCGIYETGTAATAARTAATLTRKIVELPRPANGAAPAELEYRNALSRMIVTKEEHAQLCKEQLLILWTDYFKPTHLTLFPDLHEKFWQAAKLCSFVKQHVDVEKAEALRSVVKEIADMFDKAEAAKAAAPAAK